MFCESCGRNLAHVERLPTAGELASSAEPLPTVVREFLEAMRAAGNPGTVDLPCAPPRAFRRTPKLTGWIVVEVDREDFEEPRRYEPGLFLTVDGTVHRLDSDLRGWGQRDFPQYVHRVTAEPVEPTADQQQAIRDALLRLRPTLSPDD